ncbi:hypothetical protein [Allomesorhizobium camelthorni]|uniref:Uncharacterized protein n=1 Tax=Allomesorhizobium camelthorni TaxID=475069 RepID=A0A6G4WMG9_9HYPH|nr:hypothetical protein [Mesorhizobium camelthorni]NGO55961.1 hypothetical protein [Mesorhizobium camelthorni]
MGEIVLVIFHCLGVDTPVCNASVAAYFPQHLQCVAQSQMAAAEWAGNHPKHTIRAITCMPQCDLAATLGRHEA